MSASSDLAARLYDEARMQKACGIRKVYNVLTDAAMTIEAQEKLITKQEELIQKFIARTCPCCGTPTLPEDQHHG